MIKCIIVEYWCLDQCGPYSEKNKLFPPTIHKRSFMFKKIKFLLENIEGKKHAKFS